MFPKTGTKGSASDEELYELVGGVYLHGAMKGEQWRENDCRTLSFV